MAGVLAMGIAISSLALVGGVNAARKLESTPPPIPEPIPVSVPEPVVEPAPVQQGGSVGRPKWGALSSNVVVPALPGTTVDAVKDALGVTRNPNELRLEIIETTKKLEAANLRAFQFSERYKKLLEPYKDIRQKFAKHSGESKRYEALSSAILKKLNSIGQQKKESDPEIVELKKQIEALEKNDPARKALEERKKELLKPSAISPQDVNPLTESYGSAVEKKIEADDLLEQAKFDQERSYAELVEIRAKQVEQEKLAKELKAKRDALLLQLQVILLSKDVTTNNAADWQARTQRYANALRKKKFAEESLQAFYSETWLPLSLDTKNQETYKGKFDTLKTQFKEATDELDAARIALTQSSVRPLTSASLDFKNFVREMEDIIKNLGGYFVNGEQVKTLISYAKKPGIMNAADLYYEMSTIDSTELIRNASRYLEYFTKLDGSLGKRITAERMRNPDKVFEYELTKDVLMKFSKTVLSAATANVRRPPTGDGSPGDTGYSAYRPKVNEFADKQLYAIKQAKANVLQAKSQVSQSDVAGKNVYELYELVRKLLPDPEVPVPEGACEQIFTKRIFDMLKSGVFDGISIQKILADGADPNLKEKFLNAIGFFKINNFQDALKYRSKHPAGDDIVPEYMKRPALQLFIEFIESLLRERPNNDQFQPGDAELIKYYFLSSRAPTITDITTATADIPGFLQRMRGPVRTEKVQAGVPAGQPPLLVPPFQPGPPIALSAFLQQLKSDTRFVPEVYLKSNTGELMPISAFKTACQVDTNVGYGSVNLSRVISLLDKISEMDSQEPAEENEFERLIARLEKDQRISATRPDQAQILDILGRKGFHYGISNWSIVKVEASKSKKALNFVQTFLTLKSKKFRSIRYEDSIVYKGKTVNTREVYATLFLDELKKMPQFEDRVSKPDFPTEDDWRALSETYFVNFLIYTEATKRPIGTIGYAAAQRPGAMTFNVFKAVNGMYFPIRRQQDPVEARPEQPDVRRDNFGYTPPVVLGGKRKWRRNITRRK